MRYAFDLKAGIFERIFSGWRLRRRTTSLPPFILSVTLTSLIGAGEAEGEQGRAWMVGNLRDPVFGAAPLDAFTELGKWAGECQFRNTQAEIGRIHESAHVDLLLTLHATHKHEQVDALPSRSHSMI